MKHPLELTGKQFQALHQQAVERLSEFIDTLDQQAVDTSDAGLPADLELQSLPTAPHSFEHLLAEIFDKAERASLNAAAPGFMGYVPGGGLTHAGLADLISDTLNRFVGIAAVAPALSQIEASVVQWFCEIVGYPAGAGGFLTSGGSLANLSAVITARTHQLGEDFQQGVIYASDQSHHCVAKAALMAGIKPANLRLIDSDADCRLPIAELDAAIAADRDRGLTPFLVVASAGTTNTGAIDPLDALADLCEARSLWFHVDAAYGGFFRLTQRGARALKGIERADSIVLDPHKTLFLPYGTGALLVRNPDHLRAAHGVSTSARLSAHYLPDTQTDQQIVDFCDLSPELTRPFRGLRVWLPMMLHGVEAFRDCLDEKLDLAQWITKKISELEQLSIIAQPQLSILACVVQHPDGPTQDHHTEQLMRFVNRANRTHLTSTRLQGRLALRIAIVNFRTHRPHLEALLEDLTAGLQQIKTV